MGWLQYSCTLFLMIVCSHGNSCCGYVLSIVGWNSLSWSQGEIPLVGPSSPWTKGEKFLARRYGLKWQLFYGNVRLLWVVTTKRGDHVSYLVVGWKFLERGPRAQGEIPLVGLSSPWTKGEKFLARQLCAWLPVVGERIVSCKMGRGFSDVLYIGMFRYCYQVNVRRLFGRYILDTT